MLRKFFCRPQKNVFVDQGTIIKDTPDCRVEIGEGTKIGRYCLISGKAKIIIGRNVTIGDKVQIITFDHNYIDKNRPIAEQGLVYESITIGDDCIIGSGSIILKGSVLRQGTYLPPKSIYRATKSVS
jgi:acetyltransferase-like isoleucine patch superfamily enzyme